MQWDGHNLTELKSFAGGCLDAPTENNDETLSVYNGYTSSWMAVPLNFYIARDVLGIFRVCSPDDLEEISE